MRCEHRFGLPAGLGSGFPPNVVSALLISFSGSLILSSQQMGGLLCDRPHWPAPFPSFDDFEVKFRCADGEFTTIYGGDRLAFHLNQLWKCCFFVDLHVLGHEEEEYKFRLLARCGFMSFSVFLRAALRGEACAVFTHIL